LEQEVSRSIFARVREVPADPIFGLNDLFRLDPRKDRINLTYGVCLEEDGSAPKIFTAVKKAEELLLKTEKTKTYLPILGDEEYIRQTGKFVLGPYWKEETIVGAQTVGGTAALRILSDFLKNEISSEAALSNFTWPNHPQIFDRVGIKMEAYPYWVDGKFDFDRFYRYLSKLCRKTIVQLQPTSHNPTGVDLTLEEWREVALLCDKNGLIPFFDSAYQGLGQAIEKDAAPMRLFLENGLECLIAHSYSKSMAVYAERAGALFVCMRDTKDRERISSNIASLIRTQYSNPPKHSASIAKLLLTHPDLNELWKKELEEMRLRIVTMRHTLAQKLGKRLHVDFSYIDKGCGLFSLLHLSKSQIIALREKHAVYITEQGRINLAALNPTNIEAVVDALCAVWQGSKAL
jgi:aspartate/tyrosine/aromatic aminotransferase